MNNKELVKKAKDLAINYTTLYVLGGIGWRLDAAGKTRALNAYSYNRQWSRKRLIEAASSDTWAFDCCGIIKSLCWDWSGQKDAIYGGAKYQSNGVPDIGADEMIRRSKDVSTDFRNILPGEAVWMDGHIGIYIGDGLCVECSPKWADGVQITAVANIAKRTGYNSRVWTKHGKLPWITYEAEPVKKKTVEEIAKEVIAGKWGSGSARKKALKNAGYDPAAVQAKVNELLTAEKKANLDKIAREVIAGKWGSGSARKKALKKAGYDAAEVQKRVNELLKGA